MNMYKINNLPSNYRNFKFTLFRIVENEYWYYGSENDFGNACIIAREDEVYVTETKNVA